MQNRRSVRGALLRGAPIEMVVENGFDRTVGTGADFDGGVRRRLETSGAIRAGQPNDPQTGAKALFWMRPMLQDQLTERHRRRSDQARVGADALDRPAAVPPMAERHVFRYRRVFVFAAHAHVGGDPLALEEDFDRPRGQPRVDLGAGEAMGDAIVMSGDLDVIVDTDAAHPPFGELVRFARKGLQRRTIDLFKQLPARYAEPPDRALFVEMRHQLTDRRVDLRQAVKSSMAQPPEKPSLNDEHRLLDFCFIPRTSRPSWQSSSGSGRCPFATSRMIARISCTMSPRAPPVVPLSRYSTAARISALASSLSTKFRSEEHTSELQSLRHLVCRLLLEKKKKYISKHGPHRRCYETDVECD